jgi:hypothetical protein
MSIIYKLICSAFLVFSFVWASFGFQAESVSGKIISMWISPLDGAFSCYLNNVEVRRYETTTNATLGNYAIPGSFCVIFPSNGGQNKNAMSVCLTARSTGLPINVSFYPRSSTSANNVTVSGYCDLMY